MGPGAPREATICNSLPEEAGPETREQRWRDCSRKGCCLGKGQGVQRRGPGNQARAAREATSLCRPDRGPPGAAGAAGWRTGSREESSKRAEVEGSRERVRK